MRGIPEALIDVRQSASASANALHELIGVGSRAVSNLDVSVAAFRTTLDREFAAAASLHHQSSQVLADSVRQIGDSTGLLAAGASDLTNAAQVNTAAVQRMDESIRTHFTPGNEQLNEVIHALAERLAASSNQVAGLTLKVEALAVEFDKVTSKLGPSISSFCDVIDNRFGRVVTQQGVQAEVIDRSTQQLREMADGLSQGAASLNSLLHEVSHLVGRAKSTQGALVEATNNLAEVGKQLRQSIAGDVAPSQRAMHEISASLAESTAQLSDFVVQGVKPATRQLITLHHTLTGLADTVDAIREFSNARADIDRLTDTLARASEISEAISALPEQLRQVLDQGFDSQVADADSSGRFMTWLAKRPR
jgi:hypothetical protein